jgi:hypothetical protein
LATGSLDLFADTPGLHWPEVRAWLQGHPELLVADRALLEELALRPHGPNVVDFAPAALSRLEAVVERETDARKRIETVARANFAAQAQTHVAALDLMEARSNADLARRLDASAQARFGLAGAIVALEKPGGVPFGWRALEPGRVDALVGEDGLHWLGSHFEGLNLFGAAADQVASVALVRVSIALTPGAAPRPGLVAFGSPEPDGFHPAMGCELAAFVAQVVARMAERWPALDRADDG